MDNNSNKYQFFFHWISSNSLYYSYYYFLSSMFNKLIFCLTLYDWAFFIASLVLLILLYFYLAESIVWFFGYCIVCLSYLIFSLNFPSSYGDWFRFKSKLTFYIDYLRIVALLESSFCVTIIDWNGFFPRLYGFRVFLSISTYLLL